MQWCSVSFPGNHKVNIDSRHQHTIRFRVVSLAQFLMFCRILSMSKNYPNQKSNEQLSKIPKMEPTSHPKITPTDFLPHLFGVSLLKIFSRSAHFSASKAYFPFYKIFSGGGKACSRPVWYCRLVTNTQNCCPTRVHGHLPKSFVNLVVPPLCTQTAQLPGSE